MICVHGGAAKVSCEFQEIKLNGIKEALIEGYKALINKKNALDMVEATVNSMENNPVFNAGYGSSLTDDGQVEMDAIIVDGRNLKAGAVGGVSRIANPVSLAREVMERTDHCLLIASGAEKFAQEIGIKLIDPKSLIHPWAEDRLIKFKKFSNTIKADKPERKLNESDHYTVGAVAYDYSMNFASATSTGGITAKKFGRVGDSPIIGAGGYADNHLGAVSTTGHGEAIMRICLSKEILHQLSLNGKNLKKAVDDSLDLMAKRVDGYGGAIAVSFDGQVSCGFTTEMMPWGFIDSKESNGKNVVLHYGINHDQHNTIQICI